MSEDIWLGGEFVDPKERIAQLESQLAEVQAQAAAMRPVIRRLVVLLNSEAYLVEKLNEALAEAKAALAPDAGRALLERLDRAERDASSLAATQCTDPIAGEHGHLLCGAVVKARTQALEEAAQVAEHPYFSLKNVAAAIRALKGKP